MKLPETVADRIRVLVGEIDTVRSVGGGCISNASRVEAGRGTFFLKWASGEAGETFEAEAKGLIGLREAESEMVVPEPLRAENADRAGGHGFILLEWINEGPKDRDYWSRLGRELARIHRHRGASFGFDSNNFIGRLPQRNDRSADWIDFFADRRLQFQRGLSKELRRWDPGWDLHFDRLLQRLPDILPPNPEASIVHGDLWGGNALARDDGAPAIIDPAAHFAHREVDLAMTELFGGFRSEFYRAYEETWPVDPGYKDRRDIYNLYHLINHLNHFGRSYAGQVDSIIRRY